MAAIAAEYKKGRILDIITTNLDAARPVAWNIGKIASDDSPYALQMIRDIMLASASIPAAFPPVIFDVEADGKLYDELHVDGGATSVLYLYPIGLDFQKLIEHMAVKGKPNVYTMRNGKLKRNWGTVKRNTLSIAVRTMQAQSSNVVLGDMYRIYLSTQRDGINYHLAYIPDSFTEQASESFDKAYMNKLYEFGYKKAKDGYEWYTSPPGYEATSGN
jgi:predicted acylesterase/phospholipase RssA